MRFHINRYWTTAMTIGFVFLWYIVEKTLPSISKECIYWLMAVTFGTGGYVFGWYYERVHTLSIIDPLTEAYNRHFFVPELARQLALAERYGFPVSLVIIDLDGFKAYNDQYGHLAGDRLLQAVAKSLQENTRESDTVARYGGDEFVILLPHTDATGSEQIVVRAKESLAGLGLERNFSAGVAVFPSDGDSADGLMRRADEVLYEIKNNRSS